MRPRSLRPAPLAVLLLLVAGSAAGVALGNARAKPDLLRALTREARGHGFPGARLGGLSGFRACAAKAAGCEVPRPTRRARSLIQRAGDAARAGADPRALQAAALANLVYAPHAQNLVDQSISYLQSAARMAEDPAPVLADLAAAHLVRGSAHDQFIALDAAQRALLHDPANLEARFNAAEARDRLGLRRQAAEAWTRYLAADSVSDWASHARRRLRALSGRPGVVQPPPRTAAPAEMAAFAAAAPRAARELGWDSLLAEWGAALLDGDTAIARERLAQAAALGDALGARGGDASLQEAIRQIRQQGANRPGTLRLARLHRLMGEARAAQLGSRQEAACPLYRRVRTQAAAGALREWADTFVGLCSAYRREPDYRALAALAASADSARYPAVSARRSWVLGYALQNAGRWDQALAAFERARRMADRAGETDLSAQMVMLIGNAHADLGDPAASYASLHRSLAVLREYPGSLGLYSVLYAMRNASLADGLLHATLPIQDEAVAAAAEMSEPFFLAETRLARARLHLAAGRHDIDDGDLQTAMKLMEELQAGHARASLAADLYETRAHARMAADPAGAAVELDSALAGLRAPVRRVPALYARAEARLVQGLGDVAERDLRSAADLLEAQGGSVSSATVRAALLEQSRRVYDRAVMLHVNAGRHAEALEYVERSRASFSRAGPARDRVRRPLRAPRGQVAVEYALVGDTLLAWTLWDGGMHFIRATVAREELVRTVEQVRSALELRSPEATVRPGLERLHEWLVRPVRPRFGAAETPLVIVADGELAAVPMAALRDPVRGRYLVQDHPVRFAGSLRDPAAPAARSLSPRVTLVQDPAFDLAVFPQLERLPGAAEEVRRVQREYAGAQVLRGRDAHAAAVREAFLRGSVVHFAGHAVFDDARPERSYLVTARGGPVSGARLTAAEVEGMDLRGLRLVVLSACQTSRSAAGRSGGFAGLTGAFLTAGAGGVVGSLWRVDDGYTRVLMEHFHRRYRAMGDPARALREAQLALLGSGDPALRSPAAWAGFRYAGD